MSGTKPSFHTRNPLARRTGNSTLPSSEHKHSLKIDSSSHDVEECTFEPKTNHPSGSKRSLEKFLRDQERFQRSRDRKLQQMREEKKDYEKAEVTLSPMIDPGSRKMAERQGSASSIFQRLTICPPKRVQAGFSFSPQILNRSQSIKRNADVSQLLYNDARRRQQKSQFMAETQRSLTDRNSPNPQINSNAGRLAGRKVLNELAGLVHEEQMTPLVAVLALEDLFNMDLNPTRQGEILRSLLARISYTNTDHVEVVPTVILREFVGIVVGAEEPCNFFSPADQQAIYHEFRHFYKNRLSKDRQKISPQTLSFQPQTLPASNRLAQFHRDRACQKVGQFLEGNQVNLSLREGEITIEELFILDGLRKQQENERKRVERDQKELQECTFKPNITPLASLEKFKQNNKKPKITLKPTKKKASIPAPSSKEKKEDKENRSSTYLPPRSDKKRIRTSVANNESSLKDMEKIMLRMAAGRQKREFSNTITERGYPKDQNWADFQKNMHRRSVQNLEKMRRLSFKA